MHRVLKSLPVLCSLRTSLVEPCLAFIGSRVFLSYLHLQHLKTLSTTRKLEVWLYRYFTLISICWTYFYAWVLRSSVLQIQEDLGSCLLPGAITTLSYGTCQAFLQTLQILWLPCVWEMNTPCYKSGSSWGKHQWADL